MRQRACFLMVAAGWLWLLFAPVAGAEPARVADAARRRDLASVRTLLAAHANPNLARADGATALHWAAHFDDLAMADLLIAAHADVNAANPYGVTALSLAAANGSARMVERLLTAGANPNLAHVSG